MKTKLLLGIFSFLVLASISFESNIASCVQVACMIMLLILVIINRKKIKEYTDKISES